MFHKTQIMFRKEMLDHHLLLTKFPLTENEIQQVPFNNNWVYNDWFTLYFYGKEDNGLSGMINVIHASIGPFSCQRFTIVYSCFNHPTWSKSISNWDVYQESAWRFNRTNDLEFELTVTDPLNRHVHAITHQQHQTAFSGRNKMNDIAWTFTATPNPSNTLRGFVAVNKLPVSEWLDHKLSMASLVPSAKITGAVVIDGHRFNVDCMGEVEHVWGKFVLGMMTWKMIHAHDTEHNALVYCIQMPMKDDQQAAAFCVMDGNTNQMFRWNSDEFKIESQFNGLIIQGVSREGYGVTASIKKCGKSMTEELTPSETSVLCDITIHNVEHDVYKNYKAWGIIEENTGGIMKVLKNVKDTFESSMTETEFRYY
jgi:hypothetical protein